MKFVLYFNTVLCFRYAKLRLMLSQIYFHRIRQLYITSLQNEMRQSMENILLRIFTKETMV